MGWFGASEREQHDAHGRHGPQRDGHGGGHRSGIGSDAVPVHPPGRLRDPREPCRFRAPGHPATVLHRILSGGGAAAQDLLPQFRRERGQRQQAEKRRRAQRARSVGGADLALLDVPADQVARLLGQLPIPVGQQLPQLPGRPRARCARRAMPRGLSPAAHGRGRPGRSPGCDDMPSTSARSEPYRSCLKLSSMTSRSRGFSWARMAPAMSGVRLARSRRQHQPSGPGRPVHRGPHRGVEQTLAFGAGHRVQPRAQLGGLGKVAQRGSGDDECVLHGLGCAGRVVQHPMAVAVQSSRVPVVRQGDARRVSRRDRRGDLAVYGWPVMLPARGWNGRPAWPTGVRCRQEAVA